MQIKNLGQSDGLPPMEWEPVLEQLDNPEPEGAKRHTTWLTTLNEDGSPHVTSVGALWVDGAYWFQTGKNTRKARNVARDPRCTMAVSARDADIVIEGEAAPVTDQATLERLTKAWAAQGWPAQVHESGTGITAPFNAPAQGPAPWQVYRLTPRSAIVTSNVEPGGLARFTF